MNRKLLHVSRAWEACEWQFERQAEEDHTTLPTVGLRPSPELLKPPSVRTTTQHVHHSTSHHFKSKPWTLSSSAANTESLDPTHSHCSGQNMNPSPSQKKPSFSLKSSLSSVPQVTQKRRMGTKIKTVNHIKDKGLTRTLAGTLDQNLSSTVTDRFNQAARPSPTSNGTVSSKSSQKQTGSLQTLAWELLKVSTHFNFPQMEQRLL